MLVIAAEKTREVDVALVREFLRAASSFRRPLGHKVSLIVFGERAVPILDPTESWELLPEAYDVVPLLGKSADLLAAVEEAWEVAELEEEPRAALFLWSAAVRPKHKVELALRFLERGGMAYRVVALRPSMPGWAKYHEELAKAVTYRNNMSVEKLYIRLAEELERAVGRKP
ncbi:MAG: hypothetical protein N3F67_00250 [Acidilobaceae archaeon]|nr:hypothetical protein [Acidilobaceae archaeon]